MCSHARVTGNLSLRRGYTSADVADLLHWLPRLGDNPNLLGRGSYSRCVDDRRSWNFRAHSTGGGRPCVSPVRGDHARTDTVVEAPIHAVMVAQRECPESRAAKHPASVPRQSPDRRFWRDGSSLGRLFGDTAHCTTGYARHGTQQVPRLRIPVKHLRDFPDAPRQMRRGFGHRFRDLG